MLTGCRVIFGSKLPLYTSLIKNNNVTPASNGSVGKFNPRFRSKSLSTIDSGVRNTISNSNISRENIYKSAIRIITGSSENQ